MMNNNISLAPSEVIKTINGIRVNGTDVELSSSSLSHWVYEDREKLKGNFQEDFASLSEEEFIRIAKKVIDAAVIKQKELNNIMSRMRAYDDVVNMMNKRAEMYAKVVAEAEKRYKKEFYKNNFIKDTMKAHDLTQLKRLKTEAEKSIRYFFFDMHFGAENGISEFNIENEEVVKNALKRIYETVKDNPIMYHAKGLRFHYTTSDSYCLSVSFPTLEFVMDAEGEGIIAQNKENLCRSITNFYKDTKYWGD